MGEFSLSAAPVFARYPAIALPTCMHASTQVRQVASQAIANVYHPWKSQSRLPDTLTLLTHDVHWDFSILKCSGGSFFLALISQTVSYLKTAGKLFLVSLVEVVCRKSMGQPFSFDTFVFLAICCPSKPYSLTSILLSERKWIALCFWRCKKMRFFFAILNIISWTWSLIQLPGTFLLIQIHGLNTFTDSK